MENRKNEGTIYFYVYIMINDHADETFLMECSFLARFAHFRIDPISHRAYCVRAVTDGSIAFPRPASRGGRRIVKIGECGGPGGSKLLVC